MGNNDAANIFSKPQTAENVVEDGNHLFPYLTGSLLLLFLDNPTAAG